ncbi:MAG: aldo/keto reductase [Planctomycetes bacterium]|nr:aldo/keto reductase [Planctomycetota bacterium]
MADRLNWGILSTARIAGTFAKGLAQSRTGRLVAVGSRSKESAEKFAQANGNVKAHASYEALLADPEVHAVYVATPHPLHPEWAIKTAEAGKHVLCEKPVALNQWQAQAIVEAAARNDVFLMEAFMYRCHPQTAKLVELIKGGAIGQVRAIEASFAFDSAVNPKGRLYDNALGGGGILDVGCYPVSMARLLAGAATGKPFAEPESLKAVGCIGETNVDEWTAAVAKFPGDIVATLCTGVRLSLTNTVRVTGSEGSLLVPTPWIPARDGGVVKILHYKKGKAEPEEIAVEAGALYALEADTVAKYLEQRQSPTMSWDDTIGNMATLDRWRAEIGLSYPADTSAGLSKPVHGGALKVRPKVEMTYGEIPRVTGKKASRLVMGVDNQKEIRHAAALFDEFFECGGNFFDTAYVYGGGKAEPLLGEWIRLRGVREQVVVIGKGAHTPHCNPEALTKQLLESLERQQNEYLDVYMMHRDNPEVPVGEFVDAMAEHHRAGRIRAYGGSNWTKERVDEANAYARKKGVPELCVLSNNFSLARMVEPPWKGCMAASEPDYRKWLTANQLTLLPWSSQARGFFVRGDPAFTADAELVKCWYCDDNFKRLARVREFAQKRGVLPINVALAYVLCQPFPTFPLIGPRTLAELRTSLPGLALKLTPQEVRWLNLED